MNSTDFTSEETFTNVDAQGFVFELLTRGPELIDEVVNQKGRLSAANVRRLLAAGETLAAANGQVSSIGVGSTLIEEWLFDTQYSPEQGLSARCADRIEKSSAPAEEARDLLTRLRLPARKIKHKPPKPDRKSFRELLKWLNSSTGDPDPGATFDRQGNAQVYLYYVSANAGCKLINYRKVHGLELPLNDHNDPRELAAGLPILLRGWANTLDYLLIEDVPHLSDPPNPPRFKALAKCEAELANLPLLEKFVTQYLFFDDNLLHRVCQNPRLSNIEIKHADITHDAIEILARCPNLEAISISTCPFFPYEYRDELVARCPQAEIVEVVERKFTKGALQSFSKI